MFYEDTKVHRLTFDCDFRVGTRLQSVLKPMFMFDRLFCSADMCVVLRLCHTTAEETLHRLTEKVSHITEEMLLMLRTGL